MSEWRTSKWLTWEQNNTRKEGENEISIFQFSLYSKKKRKINEQPADYLNVTQIKKSSITLKWIPHTFQQKSKRKTDELILWIISRVCDNFKTIKNNKFTIVREGKRDENYFNNFQKRKFSPSKRKVLFHFTVPKR